jgi:hypothetical protein
MQEISATNQTAESATDVRLEEFLSAAGTAERDRALMFLLDEIAEPAARKIIRQKLRGEENADDIWQEISVQLLVRLAELRQNRSERPIANFRAYAAVTAYRVCADFLRRKYPLRFSLRNKLRYLLGRDAELEIRETAAGDFLCGRRGWPARSREAGKNENYRKLLETPAAIFGRDPAMPNFAAETLPKIVRAIFDFVETPVELDDLTSIVAELQGVRDQPAAELDGDEDRDTFEIAEPGAGILDELAGREYIGRLWAEIQDLPVRQRAALLLNLRDAGGGNALEIFLVAGSASPKALADALEMSEAEFVGIWHELPFDDRRIAEFLGATRQQVINLRKCAREKLGRRLK